MSDNIDIVISLRGTSAASMEKKAAAMERLAVATARMGVAAKALPGSMRLSVTAVENYGRSVKSAGERTDRFGNSVGKAGNALDNFLLLFNRMVRIMSAYFIITTITRAFQEFTRALFEAPAKMELWSTQLATLTGNASIAAEKLELLKDVAIETPLELPDLFQGLVTLRAFNTEISDRTLRLIADLSAVSGRTFADVSEVVGKVIQGSAQAITRSLPTVGINPMEFKKLAAETGNRADALFQMIEEKFKDFALASSSTTIGMIGKIKDAFFVSMADIGASVLRVLRPQIEAVFNAMERFRRDPEAIARFGAVVAGVAEKVVALGRAMLKTIDIVSKLVSALGGLHGILSVYLAVSAFKLAQSFALAVAAASPMVMVYASLAAAASIFMGRIFRQRAQLEDAARAQRTFADELSRTNRLYRDNVALVDAATAMSQASTLTSLLGEADLATEQGPRAMAQFAEKIARLSAGFGQHNKNAVMEAVRVITGSLGAGMTGDQSAIRMMENQTLYGLMPTLFKEAQRFKSIAEQAMAAKIDADFSIGELEGEGSNALPGVDYSWIDTLERARKEFLERAYVKPFEAIKARFEAGFLSEDDALAGVLSLRDQIKSQAAALLGPEASPMDIELGIQLTGVVSNIDSFVEKLKEDVKNPISDALESAIRQAVQRGSDVIADALANIISPSDGESITRSLLRAFAGLLNAFGDILIQLAIAKLAFDELISKIVSMTPGGWAAALAAGIALKAVAGAMVNSLDKSKSGASSGGGYGGGARSGPVAFPTFAPQATAGPIQVSISTMDAKGVQEFLQDNLQPFGQAVRKVADMDRSTRGSAFGAFSPAFAR